MPKTPKLTRVPTSRIIRSLEPADGQMRTLWRAKLRVGERQQDFLFRQVAEFDVAAKTATQLLESAPGEFLSGATIIAVEKVGHLWN